jgi:hypothetical protein
MPHELAASIEMNPALTRDVELGRVLFIERFVRLHDQRQAVGTAESFEF